MTYELHSLDILATYSLLDLLHCPILHIKQNPFDITKKAFLGGATLIPPKITFIMSRFMASHMIFVRIAPLKPISEPTTVSVGLPSSMPSATNAQPE